MSNSLEPFKIREETQDSSAALSKALADWFIEFGPPGMFRTCATCKHMKQDGPAECLKYTMTPPVEVIIRGCDTYHDVRTMPFD